MGRSPTDIVTVEAVDENVTFDKFTSLVLSNSIVNPSEASFEVGDEGTFNSLIELTALGAKFRVFVNSRPRLKGRIEVRNSPLDAAGSSVIQFTVRTRLTDAMYSSADPKVRTKDTSIKQFILDCYATIGLVESDFVFRADVARELITGRATRGGAPRKDIDTIKEDQAKVRPPESPHGAVERHLRRHGFMQWDAPDGRIVIGEPDDAQNPIYRFRILRHGGAQNNLLSAERAEDIGQSPSVLTVGGTGGGRVFSKAKVSAVERRQDVIDRGFVRPVLLVDESIKTNQLAQRRARREMANRTRMLDRFVLRTDGLSYNSGSGPVNYAPDTTCDLNVETLGGAVGRFYLEEVTMQVGATSGQVTKMTVVPPGVWVL